MEDAHHRSAEDGASPIKTVLIVEDEEDIRLALEVVLKEETPYHAMMAPDGFAALKIVRTVQPDLVVVDYHLPAMDGIALVDALRDRSESAQVPILFMSACPPRSEIDQRHLLLLEKPFAFDLFMNQVKELLAA